jgi:hypothetical protein
LGHEVNYVAGQHWSRRGRSERQWLAANGMGSMLSRRPPAKDRRYAAEESGTSLSVRLNNQAGIRRHDHARNPRALSPHVADSTLLAESNVRERRPPIGAES